MALRHRLGELLKESLDRSPASKAEMAAFLREQFWPGKSAAASETHLYHCLNPDRTEKLAIGEYLALCIEYEMVDVLEWALQMMGYEVRRRWRDDQLTRAVRDISEAIVAVSSRLEEINRAQRELARATGGDDTVGGQYTLRWCRPEPHGRGGSTKEIAGAGRKSRGRSVRCEGGHEAVARNAGGMGAPVGAQGGGGR